MTTTILKATAQQFVGEFVRGYDRIAPAETIRLENGVLCGMFFCFFRQCLFFQKKNQ